jgi:hypothetical protein
MHLSFDRRYHSYSLNISNNARRSRQKPTHIFSKKKKARRRKKINAPFIARTLTVVDRTEEEDLVVDRTTEEEPIAVDRACAEEIIFFLSCRTQKRSAWGEYEEEEESLFQQLLRKRERERE